ncbi:hypothetical protein D3C76_1588290 [compost metagenome]
MWCAVKLAGIEGAVDALQSFVQPVVYRNQDIHLLLFILDAWFKRGYKGRHGKHRAAQQLGVVGEADMHGSRRVRHIYTQATMGGGQASSAEQGVGYVGDCVNFHAASLDLQ